MASGEVVIQSMWSPAITAVKSRGIPCVYQPLEEGYRSWGGGIGLSASLSDMEPDAAYEYINWYLSGWVGGFLMRQGYYSAVPETSQRIHVARTSGAIGSKANPPPKTITNPFGDPMAQAGETVRDGGSASTTGWARSPAGMLSWTKTTTWSPSGTSSSPLDPFRPGRLRPGHPLHAKPA